MYSPRPTYASSASYGSDHSPAAASTTMGTRTPRRLSVSNNAQWTTAQGRASPAIVSGYALSLNESSSSSPQAVQQSLPSSSSAPSLHRSPSTSSVHSRTIRQLDPVSIFERLGLGDSNTTLLTSSGTERSTYPGPSPGREDADLPSEQFEGIPEVATPVPMSSSISSASISDIAFKEAGHDTRHSTSTTTPTPTTSSSQQPAVQAGQALTPDQALLKLASVPPVDLVDPSIHPPHAIILQYPSSDSNTTESNSKIIPVNEDILLPFVDRSKEVRELLEQEPRNIGLFNKLKEVFEPHPSASNCSTPSLTSSSNTSLSHSVSTMTSTSTSGNSESTPKHIWQDVESILYKSRDDLKDQEWIDSLKSIIFPRSTALWERLRACLGIDVDDEQGGDKFEELSYDDYNSSFITPSSFQSGNHTGFMNIPQSSHQQHQATASPAGGDVFSLISPPAIVPSPASNADVLSPRAILRTHGVAPQHSLNPLNIPGTNSPSFSGGSNLKASQFHSPAGSTGVSPSPSPGPGNAGSHLARQFDRTTAPGGDRSPSKTQPINLNNPTSGSNGGGGSIASSPGASSDSSRMHRRTSSGGSSFRRAFAMSSISEDAPVVDFSRDRPTSTSGTSSTSTTGPPTPSGIENQNSNPYNNSSNIAESPTSRNLSQQQSTGITSGFDLGNLLKSKGVAIDETSSANTVPAPSSPLAQFRTNAMNIPAGINTSHPSMQESALSTSSSSSSFITPSFTTPSTVSGHSISLGQANLSGHTASSMLGLNMEIPNQHHQNQISSSPSIARSPSFSISSRINALSTLGSLSSSSNHSNAGGLGGGSFSLPMHSPSFNATYNKRAYDEYNPVFESDDGSSVASSVRSTGRGPGMRRSFGQVDAMSPIRSPNLRIGGGGGGFALAGLNIGKAASAVKESSGGNQTPKP